MNCYDCLWFLTQWVSGGIVSRLEYRPPHPQPHTHTQAPLSVGRLKVRCGPLIETIGTFTIESHLAANWRSMTKGGAVVLT